jgi:hypothetical protein
MVVVVLVLRFELGLMFARQVFHQLSQAFLNVPDNIAGRHLANATS